MQGLNTCSLEKGLYKLERSLFYNYFYLETVDTTHQLSWLSEFIAASQELSQIVSLLGALPSEEERSSTQCQHEI